MDGKIAGLLGMSRRAGRLSLGFDAVVGEIASGKAALILLAADASAKTCKEIRFAITKHTSAAPLCTLAADKQQLARVLGAQKPVGVCCINDAGFATALQKAGVQPNAVNKEEETRL